jgi:predicted Zn-dependent protease
MRNLKFWGLATAFCLLLATGCVNQPPIPTQEEIGPPTDVYLVPLGNFPYEFADQIARKLSSDLKIQVRASLPMGIGDIKPLPKDSQLATQDIIISAHEVGKRLPNTSEKFVVIALTDHDINDAAQSLRFLFARNDLSKHTSVISVARMRASTPKEEGTPTQVGLRIYKMLKRTIGEQYFGLPRTADISNIMYAPIMSLEDIDSMGTDYKR